MVAYLDTSAAMKLVFDEPGSEDLEAHLASHAEEVYIASWLLHTELHCAAGRRAGASPDRLAVVLSRVDIVDLTRGDLLSAGTLAPLRAQDAVHLAVALRLGVDEMITYDREQADAAHAVGLRVLSPGA